MIVLNIIKIVNINDDIIITIV